MNLESTLEPTPLVASAQATQYAAGRHTACPQEQAARNLISARILRHLNDLSLKNHAEAAKKYFDKGDYALDCSLLGISPGAVMDVAKSAIAEGAQAKQRRASAKGGPWMRLSDSDKLEAQRVARERIAQSGSLGKASQATGVCRSTLHRLAGGMIDITRHGPLKALGLGHIGTPTLRGALPAVDNPTAQRIDRIAASLGNLDDLARLLGYSRRHIGRVRIGRAEASDDLARKLGALEATTDLSARWTPNRLR